MKKVKLIHIVTIIAALAWVGVLSAILKKGTIFKEAPPPKEFIPTIEAQENWYGVYFDEEKIGYATISLEDLSKKDEELEGYAQRSYLRLEVSPFFKRKEEVTYDALFLFDNEFNLKSINVSFAWAKTTIIIIGKEKQGVFVLEVDTSGVKQVIEVPQTTLISSSLFFDFFSSLKDIPPTLKVFNPLTLQEEKVEIIHKGKEKMYVEGTYKDLYLFEIVYQGINTFLWLDEKGTLIKQSSPMGISIVKEEREVAKDLSRASTLSFPSLSVPQRGKSCSPFAERVKLAITGDLGGFDLESSNQKLLSQKPNVWIVEVKRDKMDGLKSFSVPLGEPKEFWPYLEDEVFIEVSDPAVESVAKEIIGEETDALTCVSKTLDWVHKNIEKHRALSLPSAKNVLKIKRGDCNEHTNLFVALLRSMGIPAKVVVGLLQTERGYFYHAWASVYLGRWVDIDPVRGEFPASTQHLKLLEGGVYRQVNIVKLLGKIKIKVIECE